MLPISWGFISTILFSGTFCGHFAVTRAEASAADLEAAFLLILGLQLVSQIGVAHTVQVGHTLADETVDFGAIKEVQRSVQGEPRLLRKGFHHPGILFCSKIGLAVIPFRSLRSAARTGRRPCGNTAADSVVRTAAAGWLLPCR